MLGALITARSLVPAVPAVLLIGATPPYFWMWFSIRMMTLPLPKRWYHRLEQFLCWGPYQRYAMFFMEWMSGIELKVYGDVPESKDAVNCLLVANHQCVSDAVIVDSFAMRLGNAGYIHFMAKNGLKYVPLYGVYWHQHGLIFVKRGGDKDITSVRAQLANKRINNIPMMLTLFPEGTRFNPDKKKIIDTSHAYARSLGLKECDLVLTPRITGANLCLEELGDHLEKIFDMTVAYEDMQGQLFRPDTTELFDRCKTVHIHISQRPISINKDDPRWLYESFQEKEQMLQGFTQSGTFPDPVEGTSIYSTSALSETIIPLLYTAALCSPLLFSSRCRKLYLQTILIVPCLQLLAKPFWK